MKKYGDCQKCSAAWVEVFLYGDRYLGKSCGCFDEEVERDTGKHIKDEQSLEVYRDLVARTNGIAPSVYSAT